MTDTCSRCGKPVRRRPASADQIVCHDCRRRSRRAPSPRPPLQPCGTRAAALRHYKRGEKPCAECAEAVRQQARRDRCSVCGEPVSRGRTSRPEIVCHGCRGERLAREVAAAIAAIPPLPVRPWDGYPKR